MKQRYAGGIYIDYKGKDVYVDRNHIARAEIIYPVREFKVRRIGVKEIRHTFDETPEDDRTAV